MPNDNNDDDNKRPLSDMTEEEFEELYKHVHESVKAAYEMHGNDWGCWEDFQTSEKKVKTIRSGF